MGGGVVVAGTAATSDYDNPPIQLPEWHQPRIYPPILSKKNKEETCIETQVSSSTATTSATGSPDDPNDDKDKDKDTSHGKQRIEEGKYDSHRGGTDTERAMREGTKYKDLETGADVYIRKGTAYITKGRVTNFRIDKSSIQKRLRNGKWERVNK